MADSKVQITKKPLPATTTAIQSAAPLPVTKSVRKQGLGYQVSKALSILASLRLTVVLFALAIILVFSGTVAQIDSGLWTALEKYFRSYYVWIPLQIYVDMFTRDVKVGGGFPFPGGWLIGGVMLVNLLAAHAVRFKLSWKRSGIIVLHAGLIIMLLSEWFTGTFAAEGSMLIYEGKSANYVMNPRTTELAIVAEGAGEMADVVVVPQAMLRKGTAVIKHESLPFNVQVVDYMVNSRLCKQAGVQREFLPHDFAMLPTAPAGSNNPATAGVGAKEYVALNQREVGGVEQKEDQPAAYVRFLDSRTGADLGTFLVGIILEDIPQAVTVDGKKYSVSLRRQRTYKPYTMHLIKFTHDKYLGTEKPKDFRSRLRLTDPSRNEDREVEIYMNNPLYYGGETFYQQSFLPGDKATILQVVHNIWWPMPYISFFTVAAGLLIHFGIRLISFLSSAPKVRPATFQIMDVVPAVIVGGLGAVYLLAVMLPGSDAPNKMQLSEAAELPVNEGGRVMPLDTLARNKLMIISDNQDFVDADGKTQPAIKWLLDVMTSGEKGPALRQKVFRITNHQVLDLLHLDARPGNYRYSLLEILGQYQEFDKQFKRAAQIPEANRTLFEAKVFELGMHLRAFQDLSELETPLIIPPHNAGQKWRSLRDALRDGHQQGQRDAPTDAFIRILSSYSLQDAKTFNAALANYRQLIESDLPPEASRVGFETFFNHFSPFKHCGILYVFVLVLAASSWVAFGPQLKYAAFGLAVVLLCVHTFALVSRMYLMDRPFVFVTNLYSSAVFIGWVCVVLGLVLERIYQNGLGSFIAGVLGGLTLLIGHYLSKTGDTLEMMQAVLDTNFWLATHVTSVTIGYSATFIAGFLGIVFVGLNVFSAKLPKELFKTVGGMIYGIVCFALLFSFVGTVLGGLWADYSWGRFWGWDPKENGALLIVLWNALILHARWCGLVQQRGVAVLAVGGNIVTTWSWFGTNMLGVGLHAYASASGVYYLLAFDGIQLGVIALGLVPPRVWANLFFAKSQTA